MKTYKKQNIPKIILTFCLFLFTPLFTVAKPISREANEFHAKIEVIVNDSSILNHGPDIQFRIYKDGINSEKSLHTNFINFKLQGNRTYFQIPLSTSLNYVKITYKYKPQSVLKHLGYLLSEVNNLYIFQTGDKIRITLSKKGVKFSGKGSEKFTCMYDVYNQRKRGNTNLTSYYNSGNYVGAIRALKNQEDSLYKVRRSVLAKYKPLLAPEVYQLYAADIWATYNNKVVDLFYTTLVYNTTIPKAAISQVYSDFKRTFDSNFLPVRILANSFRYCDFLNNLENFVYKHSMQPASANFNYINSINASIKKKYAGLIKDKLCLVTIYRIQNILPDFIPFLDDAINNASESKYKVALTQLKESISGKAYSFELPDQNGKTYRLDDFKGKLIIMDFWFTGCIPCQKFATELHPIIEYYKNNPNIVFISVSIDGLKNKDLWVKSLLSEKYTSKNGINLLAVEGINSKIIQHYNITGYPTLLIISETGQIITTTPPRPDSSVPGSADDFKAFIAAYLNKSTPTSCL